MTTTTENNPRFRYIILGTATALFLTGCPSKPKDICDDGEPTCAETTHPFGCWNFWGVEIASCQENLTAAHAWCATQGGGSLAAYEVDCGVADGDDEVGDPGWDPGDYVSNPSAGVYNVDSELIDQIKDDFNLLGNDPTILVESAPTDYFELSGVARGDLADVLGLQTGDILLSVNRYSLDGIDGVMTAYSAVEDDSTLVLAFNRSNTIHYHTYYIIYSHE